MRTVEAEAVRIAAIRRHRGKPEVIASLKARILALVLAGESAKSVGLAVNLSSTNACKWIRTLGFRLMYVTAAERRRILAKRRADKARENSVQ